MPRAGTSRFPKAPLWGALAMVVVAIAAAAGGRIWGVQDNRVAGVSAVQAREFRVADGTDGSVLITDAASGRQIDALTGQNGFLRGTLRALARERRLESMGAQGAFRLTAWSDGRLTLDDVATGRHVELDAFGSDNVAVFARLLTMQGSRT